MARKTRKSKAAGKTRKVSKGVGMQKDPETVWGKNPALEAFWRKLASGRTMVLIHKDKSQKYVKLPDVKSKTYHVKMAELEGDANVVAILSSSISQDEYEIHLYPKAKSKTVAYVIDHYASYFKPMFAGSKLRIPA
jgi:hypothetical protein